MKAQAAHLIKAAGNSSQLNENLEMIAMRLQECAFMNAKFTRRLDHEMTTQTNLDKAQNDAERCKIIRDTFSIHLVLSFFGFYED